MNSEAYPNLANAIILHAVKDWRKAQRIMKRHPKSESAKFMIKDCEDFFRSDWFMTLTDADGEFILKKLKEIYE